MHPDLPQEQAYFDRALAARPAARRARAVAELVGPSQGGARAAPPGQRARRGRSRRGGGIGRIEAGGQRWYIGKAHWDDDNDLVVVNWQAPIAAPFYTAVAAIPRASMRARTAPGNQIQAIEEILFRDLAEARSPQAASPGRCSRTPCSNRSA